MDKENFGLLVIGSPIVDFLGEVSEEFIAQSGGEKKGMVYLTIPEIEDLQNKIPQISTSFAGSSGNTAISALSLGVKTSFIGKVGNDDLGKRYLEYFTRIGGNTENLTIGTCGNGRCLSLITPDGERTMRTNLGAAIELEKSQILAEKLSQSKIVHLEGYLFFNGEISDHIMAELQKTDCLVSIDLASFEMVRAVKNKLKNYHFDLLFANEDEAKELCGENISAEGMVRKMAENSKIAILKLGEKGSLIFDGEIIHRIPVIPVEKVVDATAAGDYYAGGFLYGFLQGFSLKKCGEIGTEQARKIIQIIGTNL